MNNAMKDVDGKIRERQDRFGKFFEKKDADGRLMVSPQDREAMKSLNDELADLQKERATLVADIEAEKALQDSRKAMNLPYNSVPFGGSGSPDSGHDGQAAAVKSLGEMFVESDAFKSFRPGAMGQHIYLKMEGPAAFDAMKTTMTTSAGYAPANNRTNIVVPLAVRTPVIADLIPTDGTTDTLIRYLRETTWNRNAATVAEGALKPESNVILTEVQSPVQVIATTMKVTNQQLADVPGIRGYLDNRLATDVRFAEEDQILNGNGTSPNLQGFLTTTGILTGAAANQGDVPAAILRQMTQVQSVTGFADVNGIVMHPLDAMDIRLMTTSTGEFLWGAPSETGIFRIWGVPIIATPAMTQNTALLGDFRNFSHISRRMEMAIDVGYVNDDFTKNLATIRAETRLSLEIRRPSAFSLVTGV
jgi:HK97 family phage major capsid protein